MSTEKRNTRATRRKQDNLRKLIVELGTREMLSDDISFFFEFSPSGTRKYIRALLDAGVIEMARHVEVIGCATSRAVYRLSQDADRVRAYLAALGQGNDQAQQTTVRKGSSRVQCAPGNGRNFHIMADDTHYPIKPAVVVVARDPLVSALFGAPGVAA